MRLTSYCKPDVAEERIATLSNKARLAELLRVTSASRGSAERTRGLRALSLGAKEMIPWISARGRPRFNSQHPHWEAQNCLQLQFQ